MVLWETVVPNKTNAGTILGSAPIPRSSSDNNSHRPLLSSANANTNTVTIRTTTSASRRLRSCLPLRATAATAIEMDEGKESSKGGAFSMNLLFVEMGVGYDQHGQDITAAAMRACRDAISSNSIPAFRIGSIPGVNADQMKLKIKLGVPRSTQQFLDIERVKSVFPYGEIISIDVVDGGMICSSGVYLEAMGDKSDDCYVVNAAVYVGY